MRKVLSIAGSDPSGGAGIQADIKTITAHKMYAMTAITALTAQNTTGVRGGVDAPAEFVASQIDCVFDDIRPDSVKIGMVSSIAIIEAIADRLSAHRASNVVLDPVMVATSGGRLISGDAKDALTRCLFPLADIITPNIPEAEVLCGLEIRGRRGMEAAAAKIAEGYGGAILIKGGHMVNEATDLLLDDGKAVWFEGERVDTPNTHGTGCTLSSAIACGLAAGLSRADAVRSAKRYLTGALRSMLDLGQGSGPVDHCWALPASL